MNLVGSLLISALVIFPALLSMRVYKTFFSVTVWCHSLWEKKESNVEKTVDQVMVDLKPIKKRMIIPCITGSQMRK